MAVEDYDHEKSLRFFSEAFFCFEFLLSQKLGVGFLDRIESEDIEILHIVVKLIVTAFFGLFLQLAFRRHGQAFDLGHEIVRKEEGNVAFGEFVSHLQNVVELPIDLAVSAELPLVTIEAFLGVALLAILAEFEDTEVLRHEITKADLTTQAFVIGDIQEQLVLQVEEGFAFFETLDFLRVAGEHKSDEELVVHNALVAFHVSEGFQERFVTTENLAELPIGIPRQNKVAGQHEGYRPGRDFLLFDLICFFGIQAGPHVCWRENHAYLNLPTFIYKEKLFIPGKQGDSR